MKVTETLADRLDSMADKQVPGSQEQSDLYAAANIWRKHLKGPVVLQDTKRLEWVMYNQAIIWHMNGMDSPTVYSVSWNGMGEIEQEWHATDREAIDAAMKGEE